MTDRADPRIRETVKAEARRGDVLAMHLDEAGGRRRWRCTDPDCDARGPWHGPHGRAHQVQAIVNGFERHLQRRHPHLTTRDREDLPA